MMPQQTLVQRGGVGALKGGTVDLGLYRLDAVVGGLPVAGGNPHKAGAKASRHLQGAGGRVPGDQAFGDVALYPARPHRVHPLADDLVVGVKGVGLFVKQRRARGPARRALGQNCSGTARNTPRIKAHVLQGFQFRFRLQRQGLVVPVGQLVSHAAGGVALPQHPAPAAPPGSENQSPSACRGGGHTPPGRPRQNPGWVPARPPGQD